MKLLVFILMSVFYIAPVFATEEGDDSFFLFEELEDINCFDLATAFNEYSANNNLHNASLISALRSTLEELKGWEDKKQITLHELEATIEILDNTVAIADSNQVMQISETDNLAYSLQDCSEQI